MLKRFAGVTAAVLAMATWIRPASAEPITISLAATVGISLVAGSTAAAVATAVLTTTVSTALSVGLSFLSAALSSKPKPLSGTLSQVQFGGDVPRSIPMGEVKLGGQLVYFCGVGEKNKELHLVYALADWECEALTGIIVSGEKKGLTPISVVGTEHARYSVSDFNGKFEVAFFRGTMTQTADSELVSAAASRSTGIGAWTSSHRGAGVCYLRVKLTYDEDVFQGGIPRCEWILKGARLYDRRKDSTSGGSGAHRWNDPTTWEYSANPVVMDENFRRGFYRNGQRILGMGMPASTLLADYYVAAANVCDEALTEGGNSEKRYVCSVIVNDDAEWHIAVDAFRTAYAGDMLEKYGQFGPIAGAAQSIVGTFTDGDLSKDHATSFSLKLPRSDLVNQVYGSFINPDKNWENDAFAPVTDSGWLAEDNNEPRAQDAQLLMVPKRYQANRIAQILARKARQPARHTGVYGPQFAKFEPGDWVTVTNRFGSFTMMITAKERVAPLVHQFSFRQIAASVYGGTGTVVTPPTVVEVSIPPHVTTISGFAVQAVSIAGANGQIRPGIKVDWNPPSDPSAVAVRIEYRVVGTTNAQPIVHLTPADGTFTIQSDLMAGTDYELRARYVLEPDLTTTWSSWLTVRTTSAYVVATSRIASDTQSFFDRFQAEVEGEGLSNILEALKTYQSDEGIRYTFNAAMQQVLATQDASYAAVTVTMQALASADAAFASSLTTVEAKADGATAFGAFKMEAEAAGGGALASIAAFVSADSGASFARAGWRLDVYDDASTLKGRMVVEAESFAINVAGTPVVPFAVIGPDTYINRVVVNDEILSDNYAEDANGSPVAGFRLGDDGRMSSFEGDFFDMQAKGGSFTERPLISAATIFRNGIPVDTGTAYWVESVAGAVTFPFDTDARFYFASFVRSPDKIWITASGVAKDGSTIMSTLRKEYLIPPGKLLPPVMTLSQSSVSGVIELRDDGTVVYVDYDSNGAPVTQSALAERWIYNLEKDPTNLLGATVMVGALGLSRRILPFRVPLTGCSLLKCDVLGAGGGYDNSTSGIYGGPGGYVYGEIPVGWNQLVKPGDELSIIVGEGGQGGMAANALGYGGRGQEQAQRASGGGLSGIWHRDYSLRTNALLIAGGGGAGEGTAKGGPGGGTSAGGNGASDDGPDRMTGLPWARIGTAKKAGAGGGYEGGGYGSLVSSNNYGGMGGTNFIRPGVGIANSVNVGRSVDANGGSTSALPPTNITGKAIYTTWADCLGTSSLAGRGTQQTQPGGSRAGDGRVFIEIVP